MRHSQGVLLALAAVSLAGCFTAPPDRSLSRFEAQPPFTGPTGDDVVQLDVYLVERPVAADVLNREVWELANEQTLPGEQKQLLADNGFRVGRIGGSLPDSLASLLRSERSCANPRRLLFQHGKPATLVLGPAAAQHRYELWQDGRPTDVTLDQAQCLLQAAVRPASDGRMVLRFTPQVKHGGTELTPRPVQDPSGPLHWALEAAQKCESYRDLSWEVTLAPTEYVMIGALLDRPDTLGGSAFLYSDEGPRKQRMLVLRASRAPAAGPTEETAGRSPPLALQAGWTAARGAAP